jgi:hypothetical protein
MHHLKEQGDQTVENETGKPLRMRGTCEKKYLNNSGSKT